LLVNSAHDPAAGVVDAACLFILVVRALFISSTLVDAEAAVDFLVVSSLILLSSSAIFAFACAITSSGFEVVPAVLVCPVDPSVGPLDPGAVDPSVGPLDPGADDPSVGPLDPGADDPSVGPLDPGAVDPSVGPLDPGAEDPSVGPLDPGAVDPSVGPLDPGADDPSGAGDASHSSSIAAAPESTCLKQYSSDGLPFGIDTSIYTVGILFR